MRCWPVRLCVGATMRREQAGLLIRTMTRQQTNLGILLSVALLALAGCASHLAPLAVRTVSTVDDIRDVDEKQAYSRALVWIKAITTRR